VNCLQRCNNPLLRLHSKDIDGYYVILVFLPFQVHLIGLTINIIHIYICVYHFTCQCGFITDIGASFGDFPPLEHARLVDNSLVGDFTGFL
jgi:hypothetical protein